MTQTRQEVCSTWKNQSKILDTWQDAQDTFPFEQLCTIIEDGMFCFSILAGNINAGTIYSNLIGRFPVQSYKGMNHTFVAYIYKINAIMMRSINNQEDGSMIAAFSSIYHELETKVSRQISAYSTTSVPTQSRKIDFQRHRLPECWSPQSSHQRRKQQNTTSFPLSRL